MTQTPERIMQFPNDYPEERIITWKDDETGEFVGMCKYIRADLVPQWQPIETAPRDGTEILVWSASDGMAFFGRFVDGECRCSTWRTCDWSEVIYGVTHWMPLPSPPA